MRSGMFSRVPESGNECIQEQAMGGLTREYLKILASYAKAGNRSLPGRVANS